MKTIVFAITVATVASSPNPFTAYCNYPCPAPCDSPAEFNLVPCNRTHTGHLSTGIYAVNSGLWPRLTAHGVVNGGVPQRGNLSAHLARVAQDIDYYLPDVGYSGNAVIDFEAWSPMWDIQVGSQPDYNAYSEKLIREEFPKIANNTATVTRLAKAAFEPAALRFYVATLQLLRQMRPQARAGYFGYPNSQLSYGGCAKNPDSANASECGFDNPITGPALREANDRMAAVYGNSSAIFPGAYLTPPGTLSNGTWRAVQSQSLIAMVNETVRLSATYASSAPIIPFTWSVFEDIPTGYTPLTVPDVWLMLTALWSPPLSTEIVLWGISSNPPAQRHALRDAVGPTLRAARQASARCAVEHCDGHGWCRHLPTPFTANTSHVSCVCVDGWTGPTCGTNAMPIHVKPDG